ncbi:MAG TPA: nicotinate-nucleotide adenylyltransferase [Candidatus Ligilactobacillus excrementigallinarum]|uniref:Probable nicotinate-nucleotide adenylyltransferase n=1 Tax=Candidatus Ligilactobacillus excrementigallinarum TaxID=2838641 RepID=A0A9D1UXN6_9LACO|nr:nicotinate-nucleotide adenylyltransferase [Candidatus Ligilactobacillus excrementigallinarum]
MEKQKIITPEIKVISKFEYDAPQKRIGILGGTFNPPHLGHLIMAEQVLDQLCLDKVLFMPDNQPPHIDHKEAIDSQKRLQMLKLSIADNKNFGIEDYEIRKGGISYSIETMKTLTAMHPENQYYFIIGGDMVEYLPKWKDIDELVKLVQFVGVGRPGYRKESKYPVMWVDTPEIQISSTMIRQKIKHGNSIKYLVKDEVAEYIEREKLYLE